MKHYIFPCDICGRPINHGCVCGPEDAAIQERDYLAGPAPRQFPKSTGEDWYAEGRSLHRVQAEEIEA